LAVATTEALHSARVWWQGPLLAAGGEGTVSLDSSAAAEVPLTWESRTELPGGRTSPEELIAAGLASCFTMMLALLLERRGHPATRLETEALAIKELGGEFRMTRISLRVRGTIVDLDETAFREAADEARRECPAGKALRGNVEVDVEATLDDARSSAVA
jgi:lipoyl-dependent peroxiredoxin